MEWKDFTIGNISVLITLLSIYGHAAWKLSKLEGKLNIMFAWFTREVLSKEDKDLAKDVQRFFK